MDLLQRQYELEQQALNAKSETQEEQLKSLALDSTLSDALTVELQTRIATKENELNQQLNAKRNELMQKYLAELKVSSNEYDLEIVNLQLDLYAYDARVYIDDAQREAAMAEKAKKEERLKELLAKRKPSNLDVDSIKAKVQAELAPMQQKGKKSLTNMQHLYKRSWLQNGILWYNNKHNLLLLIITYLLLRTGMILGLKSFQIRKLK